MTIDIDKTKEKVKELKKNNRLPKNGNVWRLIILISPPSKGTI